MFYNFKHGISKVCLFHLFSMYTKKIKACIFFCLSCLFFSPKFLRFIIDVWAAALNSFLAFCHLQLGKRLRSSIPFRVGQYMSCFQHCCYSVPHSWPTFYDHMDCSTPGISILHNHPEFYQTHIHWVSDAIQSSHFCHLLLLPPLIFDSITVFSNELAFCIRWLKYWNFSISIIPSNE